MSATPWAWGVDCGSFRLGWAAVNVLTGEFFTDSLRWRTEKETVPLWQSLSRVRAITFIATPRWLLKAPPCNVEVEWPSGHPNTSLTCHAGVIFEALGSALHLHQVPGPHFINVTAWKKTIYGTSYNKNNLHLAEWASQFDVTDIDKAAALAIACHAASEHEARRFEYPIELTVR